MNKISIDEKYIPLLIKIVESALQDAMDNSYSLSLQLTKNEYNELAEIYKTLKGR